MRWTKLIGAIGILVASASSARAAVWETRRHWDLQAEAEFSEWMRTLPVDLFSNPQSRYYGLETDCGDTAYVLRILFAYQSGLPVRFQNSPDLSNSTSRFDSLPAGSPTDESLGKRVRAFIDLVRNRTSTEALSEDTYPIAINAGTIRPGAMFLHAASNKDPSVPVTYRSGHVYYIKGVNLQNGMIQYISSTVPEAVRSLSVRYGIVFAPQETDSGYRAWKWPDSDERPGASFEQFQIGNWHPHSYHESAFWDSWQDAIQARLRVRPISIRERFGAADRNLQASLQERATAVLAGWAYYRENYRAGQCMDESDYDDYSTPSRDVKIQSELQRYRLAAADYLRELRRSGKVSRDQAFGDQLVSMYRQFIFEPYKGVQMDFVALWTNFMTEKALEISEPEHSPQVRWGQAPQGEWVCPQRRSQYHRG